MKCFYISVIRTLVSSDEEKSNHLIRLVLVYYFYALYNMVQEYLKIVLTFLFIYLFIYLFYFFIYLFIFFNPLGCFGRSLRPLP